MHNRESAPEDVVGINRRKMLKGAAWSVPVIAMAIAAPAASASAAGWNIRVSRSCGLSILGQSGLAGFTVTNTGAAPAPGPITLTLTDAFDTPNHFGDGRLAQANMRTQTWVALQLFSADLVTTRSSGVQLSGWSDVQHRALSSTDWLDNHRYKAYRTRTVTIPSLAAGESKNIGWLLNTNLLPGTAYKQLTLTSATGDASGDETATIDPNLLAGC